MAQAKQSGEDRFFLLAFRNFGDAIESTTLAAAEIPLTVLSSMGVSDEATGAARDTSKAVVQGIHGTVDSIATQIADAIGAETAVVADALKQAAETVSREK
jgi:hypothetical protein